LYPKLFFPSFDPAVGTLLSFSTFALAFVVRPIGGLIFGHFGDRVGRKALLVTTVLLMGTATTLIGQLPTYASAGVAAPLLLVFLRVLQGISVGGEYGGAVLMVVEHAPGDPTAWLPFLNTYRTMCRAPDPGFRRILEDIRELHFD
jgi:MFS transporter, MHS family, shikimate and dehydroshikimate transport protein